MIGLNDSDIGLSGLGAREEGRSPFIEALLNAAPQEAMKALLERFAKNERFFARGELKKLFAKQNERLKLHIGADGISVGGKRLCAIYESACARTRDPLLCGELIAISSLQSVENPLSAITCNGINRILALAAKEADFTPSAVHFDSTSPLPITIFYGVQEGILLDIINDRLLCGAIIYESDVEQFIVSCYFADYERILNDGKLLIVSGKIQSQLAREYFCDNLIVNSFVRLELNLMNNPIINDAKNAIDIAHKETLRGWGTFEDENLAISHALQNANRPILTAANHIDLPIAVVGSAPSLESTLEFLRRHQDRLIIFSAGTALKPLLNGGVTPDFHIEIERTELIAKVMSDAPIGDIPLIAASIVSPVSLKVAKEALLFVRDSNAAIPLYENGHIVRFASPLVGNAALALSLKFSDQILLCGMDAGFKKDRKRHAQNSYYDQLSDESKEAIKTRGNFSANIYTNPLLFHSKSVLEMAIAQYKDKRVYNLSDGAYINGTIPTDQKDIILSAKADKQKAINMIKQSFSHAHINSAEGYLQELQKYSQEFVSAVNSYSTQNRRELFCAIHALFALSCDVAKHKAAALALRGSIWHLLHSTLKASLFTRRGEAIVEAAKVVVKETLDDLVLSASKQRNVDMIAQSGN